jgi:uncharacterized protein YggE
MRRLTILPSVAAVVFGFMLLSSPLVAAQGASPALAGITVVGHGEATAPAELASLNIIVSEANFGPPVVPQPGVVPGERERTAVAPIVASLVDAGVAEDEIDVIVGPSIVDFGTYAGPAMAVIHFTVETPNVEQLNELVDGATTAAADERLIIGRTTAAYSIEDCSALMNEARELAVADARAQADTMAEFLDVSVGDVIASRDVAPVAQPAFGPYGVPVTAVNTCGSEAVTESVFSLLAAPPFDSTEDAEVSAYADLELTFEMTGAAGATPAS